MWWRQGRINNRALTSRLPDAFEAYSTTTRAGQLDSRGRSKMDRPDLSCHLSRKLAVAACRGLELSAPTSGARCLHLCVRRPLAHWWRRLRNK